ncbi:hypothetical protein, partial [Pseudomonas viridiflava]|uniref:hypothetical protein n=1 Tax=Pseudomonas viridiflava TaxID=33069 RepID=UPI0019D2DF40
MLALRFIIIVGAGYVLLSLNLLGSTFDITVAPGYFFIFIAFAAAGAAWYVLSSEASLKEKVFELSAIPRKPWYRRGYCAI